MDQWMSEFTSIAKTIYFNEEECLRERSKNPLEVLRFAEKGLSIITGKKLNLKDGYVIRGMVGNLYRIVGETDQAIKLLTENVYYAQEISDYSKEVVSRIRLGEALKYAGNYNAAMEEFNQAITMIDNQAIEHIRDFVYQHIGKLYLELKRYDQALEFFQKAFAIRFEKEQEELINSTRHAILFTKNKMNSSSYRGS